MDTQNTTHLKQNLLVSGELQVRSSPPPLKILFRYTPSKTEGIPNFRFVGQCLKLKLTPRFINFRFYFDHPHTTKLLKTYVTQKRLQCELRRWYSKQNVTSRLAMLAHSRLTTIFPHTFDFYLSEILNECDTYKKALQCRKSQKIQKLILEQHTMEDENIPSDISENFYPRLINISIITLSNDETLT